MRPQQNIKQEDLSEDEEQSDIQLGPAALGLQRVGTTVVKPAPTQPTQVLNARGMPARIRKKNKMFYDDDIVNTPHHRVPSAKKFKTSPVKTPRTITRRETPKKKLKKKITSPTTQITTLPDRKVGQKIGLRLRNLLKLPKAHKWVCHEWFYSNIDRCLFSGDNDFTICLKESFPQIKTRELSRVEWTKIRRMMGRPRRCSQAFFNQERLDLEKKRNKIRALQQRKVGDLTAFQDLPVEIPMQLVVGTKVTARLRKPQDGLFTGSIDAVDTSNNTYRITFDRPGLGTHSVPDYEVLSNEPADTMSLNTLPRRNGSTPANYLHKSPGAFSYSNMKIRKDKDPMLSVLSLCKPYVPGLNAKMGSYPIKLLEKMVLVRKILNVKRMKVKLLRGMNQEAERFSSFEDEIPEDFERRYANIVIELEELNKDLQTLLNDMQEFCQEIAPEPSVAAMLAPSLLREKCREEAMEIAQRNNAGEDKESVSNETILELVTDLTALMLQVKCLSDSDQNAYELQVLQGTMEQIKRKLSPDHQLVFKENVECHMKHIQFGLGRTNVKKAN